MRRFIQSLLRRSHWPSTKNNYQSEIDLFLHDFNANRSEPESRRRERLKAADIAHRRDVPTDPSCL